MPYWHINDLQRADVVLLDLQDEKGHHQKAAGHRTCCVRLLEWVWSSIFKYHACISPQQLSSEELCLGMAVQDEEPGISAAQLRTAWINFSGVMLDDTTWGYGLNPLHNIWHLPLNEGKGFLGTSPTFNIKKNENSLYCFLIGMKEWVCFLWILLQNRWSGLLKIKSLV